jgi:hypothetical protein
MNMGSSQDHLVHQVIADHSSASLQELQEHMHENDFICVRQFYTSLNPHTKQRTWADRGEILLAVEHIGKVQVYLERMPG